MDQSDPPLNSLPPELLALVVDRVAPPMPTVVPYPPGIQPDPADPFRPEHDCWEALEAQRRDIQNLSLVSREFREFCLPYLWRYASIRSDEDLGVLARALRQKPDLGRHIRSIYLFVTVRPNVWSLFNEDDMTTLIRNSPNVDDVLLVIANDDIEFDLEVALPDVFRYAGRCLASWEQGAGVLGAREILDPLLPRWQTLRIRHAIEHPMRFRHLTMDIVPILPFIPTLRTLELWSDAWMCWSNSISRPPRVPSLEADRFIEFPFLGRGYPKMRAMNKIRLFGTQASEYDVASLVLACPRLEELEVKFVGNYFPLDGVQQGQAVWDEIPTVEDEAADEGEAVGEGDNAIEGGENENVAVVDEHSDWSESDIDAADDPPTVPEISISRALGALFGTLKSLSITGCGCEAYLDSQFPDGEDDRPREDHNTLFLEPLTNLKHLSIDLWALVGNRPNLELRDIDRIASRIPPSLVSLKLSMNWDMDRRFIGWSNRDALHVHELMIVAAAVTRLFKDETRRLRDFSLVHPWFPKNPAARRAFDSILDDLRAEALRAGVGNIETTTPIGWRYCSHPWNVGGRYTLQSRRHVLRKRAANRFGTVMQDEDWDVFL